jgi:rhomboid protease GluP
MGERPTALLRTGLGEAEANRFVVLLASMGIESSVGAGDYGGLSLYVAAEQLDAARRLLTEEAQKPFAYRRVRGGDPLALESSWFGRGSSAVGTVIAACVALFVYLLGSEGEALRGRMLALGAIDRSRLDAGEYWRLLTAIFLHFDAGHLLSNMAVLVVVGPPLAQMVGPWLFLLVFFASGVGGNVASYLLAPAGGLKAGASGAIAGVLGALGGLALAPERRSRWRPWQTLAALAALYALVIGFSPRSDHVAHLGGLLVGLVSGRLLGPLSERSSSPLL